MKRRSEIAGALIFAGVLLAPALASAYCRTANCPTHEGAWQVCVPEQTDDCGTELWWKSRCLGFTLQKDASSQVDLAQAEETFKKAFATWTTADCGGGAHPSVAIDYQGPVECDKQEYNKDKTKGNANVILFRDDSWPYEGTSNILALTTVTYNTETSEIYDADMEINSADIKDFTVGDTNVKYDLLSVATHESGHFLALAHSHDTTATMYTDYKQTTTTLRDLTDDDVAAICATYPPDKPSSTCDDEPRHGFSDLCGADQTEAKGCGCSVPSGSGSAAYGLAGLVGLWALRRRRGKGEKKS